MADKMYREYPEDAFKIAMGKRGVLSLSLSSAIYAKVCNELEKEENIEKVRELMNSLDNFDLSEEAQKRGYRNRYMAVEAGKEVVASRIKNLEKKNLKSMLRRLFT